jgi:hypothetical protein
MGEAKRRRAAREAFTKIAENITICPDAAGAMRRLGGADAGTPMAIALFGAGLIPLELAAGTLEAKLMAKEATTERHLYRFAFSMWDRIRTGEHSPWQCSLCAKEYAGLPMLSVFALIDHPYAPPLPNKPGVMALVCQTCDSISTEETQRRLGEMFGLLPVQEGRA